MYVCIYVCINTHTRTRTRTRTHTCRVKGTVSTEVLYKKGPDPSSHFTAHCLPPSLRQYLYFCSSKAAYKSTNTVTHLRAPCLPPSLTHTTTPHIISPSFLSKFAREEIVTPVYVYAYYIVFILYSFIHREKTR